MPNKTTPRIEAYGTLAAANAGSPGGIEVVASGAGACDTGVMVFWRDSVGASVMSRERDVSVEAVWSESTAPSVAVGAVVAT